MAQDKENFTNVMQRYELKYLMDRGQTAYLINRLRGHMEPDRYGKTTIASLYYDTPDRRLIRASLDKPDFKEKMRLRSYGRATEDSPVFLELKRKASGIVYKRRVRSTLPEVRAFFRGENELFENRQINRELNWFRDSYGELEPACLIIYDRIAYFEPEGDLRLTIDFNPRYRMEDLRLTGDMDGIPAKIITCEDIWSEDVVIFGEQEYIKTSKPKSMSWEELARWRDWKNGHIEMTETLLPGRVATYPLMMASHKTGSEMRKVEPQDNHRKPIFAIRKGNDYEQL